MDSSRKESQSPRGAARRARTEWLLFRFSACVGNSIRRGAAQSAVWNDTTCKAVVDSIHCYNGSRKLHALTSAQSATLRSALESFDADLADEGLGDDEHGVKMVEAYRARIAEIRVALYGPASTPCYPPMG